MESTTSAPVTRSGSARRSRTPSSDPASPRTRRSSTCRPSPRFGYADGPAPQMGCVSPEGRTRVGRATKHLLVPGPAGLHGVSLLGGLASRSTSTCRRGLRRTRRVVHEGRRQGSLAPYGYTVVDGGPPPNPRKSADGYTLTPQQGPYQPVRPPFLRVGRSPGGCPNPSHGRLNRPILSAVPVGRPVPASGAEARPAPGLCGRHTAGGSASPLAISAATLRRGG